MKIRHLALIILALVVIGLIWWGVSSIKGPNSAKAGDIPKVEDPVTDPTSTPKGPEEPVKQPEQQPILADQVFAFNGQAPAYSDFRAAVNTPGEVAVFVWNFTVPLDNAVISRIWPDDELISAKLLVPGQDPVDLTQSFEMIWVKAGGTGDASLDEVLEGRGVNVADGEILMQNKNSVSLGNVPAGSKLVFEIRDNSQLAVNRGIGVVVSQEADTFTVTLP